MHDAETWRSLDEVIRQGWDADLVTADEALAATADAFTLPRPFVAGAAPGSPSWYRTMFDWDCHFANLALFVHGRDELIGNHLENYLAMIDRFGYMPNGNQLGLTTRSQPPIVVDSFWIWMQRHADRALVERAYRAFTREFEGYWLAEHHATPTGLVTNRDLGDPVLEPRLAAEAETGLDFTTQFEGDVRRTNPVLTNCALVVYARTLAAMADHLGVSDAPRWRDEAARLAELIRDLCWSGDRGIFLDYRFDEQRHVDTAGASAYFALWAGVATPEQAERCANTLPTLLMDHGLSTTERPASFDASRYGLPYEDLQWTYPANWPPLSIIAVAGFDRYGLAEAALDVASRQLDTILSQFAIDGCLYEKYNAVDGGIVLPNARYGTIELHGWTAASVVLLGRRVHNGLAIEEQLAATDG